MSASGVAQIIHYPISIIRRLIVLDVTFPTLDPRFVASGDMISRNGLRNSCSARFNHTSVGTRQAPRDIHIGQM